MKTEAYEAIDEQIKKYHWSAQELVKYIAVNHNYNCTKCEHLNGIICMNDVLSADTIIHNADYSFCSEFKERKKEI